jgi:hypothetical protein
MLVHADPEQSCQWYVYEVGLFVQVPLLEVNVFPCWAVPVIAGAAVFEGCGGLTVAVLAEVADADPPALAAVTTTSIVSPTSEAWTL